MKEYEVEQPDGSKTTLLLSDEDAEAQGLKGGRKVDDAVMQDISGNSDDDEKQADAPKTKKRSASDK